MKMSRELAKSLNGAQARIADANLTLTGGVPFEEGDIIDDQTIANLDTLRHAYMNQASNLDKVATEYNEHVFTGGDDDNDFIG